MAEAGFADTHRGDGGGQTMTSEYSPDPSNGPPALTLPHPFLRRAILLGTPILLAGLFLLHPDGSGGHEGLSSVADLWLSLHVAMLPLLGLLGVSLYLLLDGYAGRIAAIGRVGVVAYTTFYVAFEAIAGVATGLIVGASTGLPATQQTGIAAAVDALVVPSVTIGLVGSAGALVAVVAAGTLLRRSGAPLVPVVLLGGAPIATVFHGGLPLDAIATSAYLVSVAWLELRWRATDERRHRTNADTNPA